MKLFMIIGYNKYGTKVEVAHDMAEADANIVLIKKDYEQFSLYELDTDSLALRHYVSKDVSRVQRMAELGERLLALLDEAGDIQDRKDK